MPPLPAALRFPRTILAALFAALLLAVASPSRAWFQSELGVRLPIDWPVPPPFEPGRGPGGGPIIVSSAELERAVREHSPYLVSFWAPHDAHFAIGGEWLGRAVEAYADLLFALGVRYTPDAWDCENYAQLLSTLVGLEMAKVTRADVRPLIGWFTVMPEVAWGGIPADRKHALVVVRTDRGLEVIEPQTGERTLFAEYPNRHRVLEVYFE